MQLTQSGSAEIIKNNPDIQESDFVDVRSNPNGKRGFFLFFDSICVYVAGKRKFTAEEKLKPLSSNPVLPISDEGFAELCAMNYSDAVKNQGRARWTDSRTLGTFDKSGWAKEGIRCFSNVCRRITESRANVVTTAAVDTAFAQLAHQKHGHKQGAAHSGGMVDDDDDEEEAHTEDF